MSVNDVKAARLAQKARSEARAQQKAAEEQTLVERPQKRRALLEADWPSIREAFETALKDADFSVSPSDSRAGLLHGQLDECSFSLEIRPSDWPDIGLLGVVSIENGSPLVGRNLLRAAAGWEEVRLESPALNEKEWKRDFERNAFVELASAHLIGAGLAKDTSPSKRTRIHDWTDFAKQFVIKALERMP